MYIIFCQVFFLHFFIFIFLKKTANSREALNTLTFLAANDDKNAVKILDAGGVDGAFACVIGIYILFLLNKHCFFLLILVLADLLDRRETRQKKILLISCLIKTKLFT